MDHNAAIISYEVIHDRPADPWALSCVVNDLVVPVGSSPSTFAGPRDEELPPPGQAFFYLIRATDQPYGATLYGFSSAGDVEAPASGDCPI